MDDLMVLTMQTDLHHGQHLVMPEDTALCNLWLTLLQTCDVPAESFGDSEGVISAMLA